jgi:hypothetical protein
MRFCEKVSEPNAKRFWIWLATYRAQARTLLWGARGRTRGHCQLRNRQEMLVSWGEGAQHAALLADARWGDRQSQHRGNGGFPDARGGEARIRTRKRPRHHKGQLGQREGREGGLERTAPAAGCVLTPPAAVAVASPAS